MEYIGNSFADVYYRSLLDLVENPMYFSNPRNLEIKENCDITLKIKNPTNNAYISNVRSSKFKYIAAELLWYFSRDNSIDFISKYASLWKKIANSAGEVNSAYGNLIFYELNEHGYTQWNWAVNTLKKDKDSRQAILHFNSPMHQYENNKDFPCTLYGIFFIRDDKLNFKIHMRSNDVIFGTPTDVAFFTILQSQMLVELQKTYPNLKLGEYVHHVDSYHLYQTHYDTANKMLEHGFSNMQIPLINESFIEEDGTPTDHFIHLYVSATENTNDLNSKDKLTQWIISTLKK